jgi:hypothetical protein
VVAAGGDDGSRREGGTEVTLQFDDLPPGLQPADNEEGARLSLERRARRFEG